MPYIIKGQDAEEIWQLNQVEKNNPIKKSKTIDFMDININYEMLNNSIINYDFDIYTSKSFTNFANVDLAMRFLNIIYIHKGTVKFNSPSLNKDLILGKNQWAIVSPEFVRNIIYSQKENTHVMVSHIIITQEVLEKFIEFDNQISQLLYDVVFYKNTQRVLAYGTADINLQIIINYLNQLKEKSDNLSKYMYILKVEELLLNLFNINFGILETSLASRIHEVILAQYNKASIKEIARALKISESTLRTKYKSEYGITPSKAIHNTRMIQAKVIYEENQNITMKELALKVGYKNFHRFSIDFKNFLNKNL